MNYYTPRLVILLPYSGFHLNEIGSVRHSGVQSLTVPHTLEKGYIAVLGLVRHTSKTETLDKKGSGVPHLRGNRYSYIIETKPHQTENCYIIPLPHHHVILD
jgi:hypothetical protein